LRRIARRRDFCRRPAHIKCARASAYIIIQPFGRLFHTFFKFPASSKFEQSNVGGGGIPLLRLSLRPQHGGRPALFAVAVEYQRYDEKGALRDNLVI
jgi:hypothetical protein